MDVLAGDAYIGSSRLGVPIENASATTISSSGYFAPLLRGVVFVSKTALRPRLDLQSICLRQVIP